MQTVDWTVLGFYITSLIIMSFIIGRKQKNQKDYYLAGGTLPPWQLGSSMAANQVSAISLIGAPAFIALREGGGLKWLQYELAIPISMILIIIFIIPVIRRNSNLTIYQYLEARYGSTTRLCMSFIFLISRSLASGVALLATSYVTSVCIDISIEKTILIIGLISLFYTAIGGIRADIISDIMQLVVLAGSSIAVIFILSSILGDSWIAGIETEGSRLRIFYPESTGIGNGDSFGLLPMIIGGVFLYVSYYGCDQSQAQRLLSADSDKSAEKTLLVNSIVRFTVVMIYSFAGVLLIFFLKGNPDFASGITKPDYIMPKFFLEYMPSGLLGLSVAGIFAASMSSLDSNINSLSAATWDDFFVKIYPGAVKFRDKTKIIISRTVTVFWGFFATIAALYMKGSSETLIELVNRIGSAFYGPVAGVFLCGVLLKKSTEKGAVAGLVLGVVSNIVLWIFFENEVAWMWWNVSGITVTFATVFIFSVFEKKKNVINKISFPVTRFSGYLFIWFVMIVLICLLIESLLIK